MVNQYIEHPCGPRSVLDRLIVRGRTPRAIAELLTTSSTIFSVLAGELTSLTVPIIVPLQSGLYRLILRMQDSPEAFLRGEVGRRNECTEHVGALD
jgi:hypothetical protein